MKSFILKSFILKSRKVLFAHHQAIAWMAHMDASFGRHLLNASPKCIFWMHRLIESPGWLLLTNRLALPGIA